ncbi:MAG: N-acetyl-D-glucosamine ABC transporter, permease protein 1, partial [uncultured Friedmanniella sp.]
DDHCPPAGGRAARARSVPVGTVRAPAQAVAADRRLPLRPAHPRPVPRLRGLAHRPDHLPEPHQVERVRRRDVRGVRQLHPDGRRPDRPASPRRHPRLHRRHHGGPDRARHRHRGPGERGLAQGRDRRPHHPLHPRHRLVRGVRCAVEADLRPERRHAEPRAGLARTREPAAHLAGRPGDGAAGDHGRLDLGRDRHEHADLLRRHPGHRPRAVRGGAGGRRRALPAVLQHHSAQPAGGHRHRHQPRPAQRVQGLRHHLRDDRRRPQPRHRGVRHLPLQPGVRLDLGLAAPVRLRVGVQRRRHDHVHPRRHRPDGHHPEGGPV